MVFFIFWQQQQQHSTRKSGLVLLCCCLVLFSKEKDKRCSLRCSSLFPDYSQPMADDSCTQQSLSEAFAGASGQYCKLNWNFLLLNDFLNGLRVLCVSLVCEIGVNFLLNTWYIFNVLALQTRIIKIQNSRLQIAKRK